MMLTDDTRRDDTLVDRIHARLVDTGPVNGDDLASEFLRLTGGARSGRLIDRMLVGNRAFVRLPDGRWAARPKPPQELAETPFVCVALDVTPSGSIHRGAAIIVRGSDTEVLWSAESPTDVNPLALSRVLDAGVIVAEHAPSLWRWVHRHVETEIAEFRALSLGRLAGGLFPEAGISALDQLAERLGIQTPHSNELGLRARRVADILGVALEIAAQSGARTLDDVIAMQYTGSAAVDFSRFAFGEATIRALPDTPGVYVMRDHDGKCLYVGKARGLRTRLRSYFYPATARETKVDRLLESLHDLEIIEAGSELAALLLEHEMIERLKPTVNTQRDVHGADVTIVPAVIVEPAMEPGSVSLIGVTATRLHRSIVSGDTSTWEGIDVWLRAVLDDDADNVRDGDTTSGRSTDGSARSRSAPSDVVIAARYLARHRDALTWLDLRQVPEARLGAERLATLIASRISDMAPARAV